MSSCLASSRRVPSSAVAQVRQLPRFGSCNASLACNPAVAKLSSCCSTVQLLHSALAQMHGCDCSSAVAVQLAELCTGFPHAQLQVSQQLHISTYARNMMRNCDRTSALAVQPLQFSSCVQAAQMRGCYCSSAVPVQQLRFN